MKGQKGFAAERQQKGRGAILADSNRDKGVRMEQQQHSTYCAVLYVAPENTQKARTSHTHIQYTRPATVV